MKGTLQHENIKQSIIFMYPTTYLEIYKGEIISHGEQID